jgi:hypothetical protein
LKYWLKGAEENSGDVMFSMMVFMDILYHMTYLVAKNKIDCKAVYFVQKGYWD